MLAVPLAEMIGVHGDALTHTVARPNQLVAAGVDSESGRGQEAHHRAFFRRKPPTAPTSPAP